MFDRATPLPFGQLMTWILSEQRQHGTVFGVQRGPSDVPDVSVSFLEQTPLAAPLGPAAGPHTHFAQSIAAAYYAGGRFFVLEPVNAFTGKLPDDPKQLPPLQAFEEYVKAWFACKLMAIEFELGSPDAFVFHMGFTGAVSAPVAWQFLHSMQNAAQTPAFVHCKAWVQENIGLFSRVTASDIERISGCISRSATLFLAPTDTPAQILQSALQCMEQNMHLFLACSPLLLGYEATVRLLAGMQQQSAITQALYDRIPPLHEVLPVYRQLRTEAKNRSLTFGLSFHGESAQWLSNGPDDITAGHCLYALNMELARRIAVHFDGQIRLMFSGGVHALNIPKLLACGIWPVTMFAALKKPGGLARLSHTAARYQANASLPPASVNITKIDYLANLARTDLTYAACKMPVRRETIRERKALPLFSCFMAPCRANCPLELDIPAFVHLSGRGKHLKALQVITQKNPLLFMTAKLCNHPCTITCVRNTYDTPIQVRKAELDAARNGFEALLGEMHTPVMIAHKRVAIIGGGPAGLAAAYFLGRSGTPVTLFERRAQLGGAVRHLTPAFRISDNAIDKDIRLVQKMGAQVRLESEAPDIAQLRRHYDAVLIATGAAQVHTHPQASISAQDFLEKYRAGMPMDIRSDVVVSGSGFLGLDAARACKRMPGVNSVTLVCDALPSQSGVTSALEDGIVFLTNTAPLSLNENTLTCLHTGPTGQQRTISLPCSTWIDAGTVQAEPGIFAKNSLATDKDGNPVCDPETCETSADGVYVIGSALNSTWSIAQCVANAKQVCEQIIQKHIQPDIPQTTRPAITDLRKKHGLLQEYANAASESQRCLHCDTVCEYCVQVCPNRANLSVCIPGCEMPQIVHVDSLCGACGNCAVYCPYNDAPYERKFTVFSSPEAFLQSKNPGCVYLGGGEFRVRTDDAVFELNVHCADATASPAETLVQTLWHKHAYLFASDAQE